MNVAGIEDSLNQIINIPASNNKRIIHATA